MNKTENKKFTPVLTIAGSDNSGGAGIQADLKTFSALGCYGLSAITAVTVQSHNYFLKYEPLSSQMVYDQITLSVRQCQPVAFKTGMIGTEENIYTIAEAIQAFNLKNLIIDPVLKSSTGTSLGSGNFPDKSESNFIKCIKNELLPLGLIATPNKTESEALSGVKINSYSDVEKAGYELLKSGIHTVIIKGGHMDFDPEFSVDTVFTENKIEKISSPRLSMGVFHGTGCTYSAALCSFIAKGFDVITAAKNAKRYVYNAMEQSTPENPGILNHSCKFQLD